MKPTPKPLTLGDIARYCHVDRVTVQRWVKTALIPAYRTPGGHYRVGKEEFRRFLQKNNMPIYPEFFQDVPHRILIADNSDKDAHALGDDLEQSSMGYEVKICTTSREALILLGQFQPDVLVLNVQMEGLGGTGVIGEIKKMFPQGFLRILAVSGDGPERREEILAAGADGCLTKPVTADSFMHAIGEWMQPTLMESSRLAHA